MDPLAAIERAEFNLTIAYLLLCVLGGMLLTCLLWTYHTRERLRQVQEELKTQTERAERMRGLEAELRFAEDCVFELMAGLLAKRCGSTEERWLRAGHLLLQERLGKEGLVQSKRTPLESVLRRLEAVLKFDPPLNVERKTTFQLLQMIPPDNVYAEQAIMAYSRSENGER